MKEIGIETENEIGTGREAEIETGISIVLATPGGVAETTTALTVLQTTIAMTMILVLTGEGVVLGVGKEIGKLGAKVEAHALATTV